MRKQFIEVPLQLPFGKDDRLLAALKALVLVPWYLGLAWLRGVPGLRLHLRIATTAVMLLLRGRISAKTCVTYLFFPMDSTRYFEFDEVLKAALANPFTRLLDVSSPRWAPLLLLRAKPGATAALLNPDAADLDETRTLAAALGFDSRTQFCNSVVDKTPFAPASFDLVTSISVVEHIPDDRAALHAMWSLVRPGGRLILTLPCMRSPLEQYISRDAYGVLQPGVDGYTFWQRFYDKQRLEHSIFAVAGKPSRMVYYGEREPGAFFRNSTMKRLLGSRYPYWREPYMMATEYRIFSSIDELPGDGVVLLEFEKPGAPA